MKNHSRTRGKGKRLGYRTPSRVLPSVRGTRRPKNPNTSKSNKA